MIARDKRALRVGLSIVGALLSVRLLVPAVTALAASRRQHELERGLLAETRETIALLPLLEDSAGSLRKAFIGLAPQLLSGSTEAMALADLSGRVKTLVGLIGGQLVGVAPNPDSGRSGELRRVSIRASFATDVRGLAKMFTGLAAGDVVLVPETALITAADPLAGGNTAERLQVEMTILGWFRTNR